MATTGDLFTSISSYRKMHKINFKSEVGDHPLTLTVQLDVSSRAGLKRLGKATHVFTFQPTSATTRPGTPANKSLSKLSGDVDESPQAPVATAISEENSAESRLSAADTAAEEDSEGMMTEVGEEEGATTLAADPDVVVFVHDRYDGHKELYVNQRLVYSVKKECTDGNMNCWSLRLSFGRVNLQLTAKLISASGFEYTMRLGNRKGVILYRAC